ARRLETLPPEKAAAPMPETGAAVDTSLFAYSRPIPDGPAELASLTIDPAALVHSSGPFSRFADVRIVDAESRQIPYLIERRDEPLALDLTLARMPAQSGGASSRARSRYLVQLPYAGLSGTLVLETPARVFQRGVQLGVDRPGDRQRRDPWFDVLANASWS